MKKVIRTACPRDCFDSCSILATVENGCLTEVAGDPQSPITKGHLCPKGEAYVSWVLHPGRLTSPLRRKGRRGDGQWEELGWGEALDYVADRLKKLKDAHGSDSILYHWGTGTHFGMFYYMVPFRFFNLMGGATNLRGSLCANAGHEAVKYTYGESFGYDPHDVLRSKYIIVWGRNVTSTNIHTTPLIFKAMEANNAKLVTIDPRRTEIANKSHRCLQPRVGTDGALALGFMNVLIEKDLYDHDFVSNHTHGFDALKDLVSRYSPAVVEGITGISRDVITEVACEYALTKPANIKVGMGLQHNTNGGQTFRAVSSLVALSGNLGRAGGGLDYPNSRFTYPRSYNVEMRMPEKNINKSTIPVVKAGHHLEQKNTPLKGLFIWAANPVTQNPDSNKFIRAMLNPDLEFSVVMDPFMTDTAKLADVILPAATSFEQNDVGISYGHPYMQIQQKTMEPLPGSRGDYWIFRQLALRLGFGEAFPEDDMEMVKAIINREKDHSIAEHITVEGLREQPMRVKYPDVSWVDKTFKTPSGKVEFYCDRLKELGCNPLPDYEEPLESHIRTPDLAQKYPLSFITAHSAFSMHSMDYKNPLMHKFCPEPVLHLNADDAKVRNIEDGDWVRIYNDRGSIKALVHISRKVGAGTTSFDQGRAVNDGCANFLTADYLTDFGENAAYFTCLVQVEKFTAGARPPDSSECSFAAPGAESLHRAAPGYTQNAEEQTGAEDHCKEMRGVGEKP